MAILLGLLIDGRYGAATRVIFGLVHALIPTLGFMVIVMGASHFLNRRLFGRSLRRAVFA